MLHAARLPWAMAWMTVWAPRTASPPAKTLGSSVCSTRSATAMVRHRVRLMPCSSLVPSSLGYCPMAAMTWSHSTMNSEPSTGTGRRRPEASGSPSSMRTHSIPHVVPPSSVTTRTGATSSSSLTPSSSASSTSVWWAGISLRERRYRQVTSSAPSRTEVRQASMAVKPPPMTATFLPTGTVPLSSRSPRKSTAVTTPSASSPGTPISLLLKAPTARKTAS